MVEVLLPNSIVNQPLLFPEFNRSTSIPHCEDDERELSLFNRATFILQDEDTGSSSAAVREKVQHQVEWYFSDENLQKDAFLMKHIARNKQGFVSLKLVASLRKVKAITKDWKVVAESIKHSKILELNDDYSKIRRLEPVPEIDYSCIPRTVIISNLPTTNSLASQIQEDFAKYGKVLRVMVLHPGKSIPLYVKSCKSRFPSIGKEVCVLVEYQSSDMAKRACRENKENWRQTISVELLSQEESQKDPSTGKRTPLNAPERKTKKEQVSQSSSSHKKIIRHKSPNGYGSDSGYSEVSRSPSISPKSSPAPTRRFFNEAIASQSKTQTRSRFITHSRPTVLVGVLRNPVGPDGTKGFGQKR